MTDLLLPDAPEQTDTETEATPARKRRGLVRRIAMRPRRILVKAHRWLSLGLLAWIAVVSLTGAWLVAHHAVESWIDPGRYHSTSGDVGPQAALDAAKERLPEDASTYGLTLPRNGRGVYQVWGELDHEPAREGAGTPEPTYYRVYVDPGSGKVNRVQDEDAGITPWLYRGHMYLWQDHGVFGAFDPVSGWCRADAKGHEPGGVKGIACDVIPAGDDMVAWLAAGFIVVLLSGFYLWYWPGVRRWATAFVVKRGRGRFTFHMSVHKLVGLVVWVPLTVVAFTGMAFAFPNLDKWFENATPAHRDFSLWSSEEIVSAKPDGREPIGADKALELIQDRFPDRAVDSVLTPYDETGTYAAWVTRGVDPWTREGGAGNAYVALDQYSGETLYDGTPEEGNVFDQVWDDWSFPLHTGDFGGTATRVLWVGLGLSPILMGATGTILWFVRRGKRAKRAS
jgi:uncharacterized iron-regulated membrane protein